MKQSDQLIFLCQAIRPTDSSLSPAMLKEQLPRDLFRLYQLIWTRFLASRMAEAVYETTSVKIGAGDYRFNVAASKVKFDGFMTVYSYDSEKSTMNAAMKKIRSSAAFYTAASTFYRSFSCKNLRRIRNRSSKHLCANNYYSFSKKIYCKRK